MFVYLGENILKHYCQSGVTGTGTSTVPVPEGENKMSVCVPEQGYW